MGNEILQEIFKRLNGESWQKKDLEKIYDIKSYELKDNTVSLVLERVDNPDYDTEYWEKLKAKVEAENEDNKQC